MEKNNNTKKHPGRVAHGRKLAALMKKEKRKYRITKNSLQCSLQHSLQNSLHYSLQYSQMKKCIIDTSGTVCLLVTFQFIKKIPENSKMFTHTLHIPL